MDQKSADSFSRKLSEFAETLDQDERRLLDSVMFLPTKSTKVVRALQINAHMAEGEGAGVVGGSQVIPLREDQVHFEGDYLGTKFDLVLGW